MKNAKKYDIEVWTKVYDDSITPTEFILNFDFECLEVLEEKMTKEEAVAYCSKKIWNHYKCRKKTVQKQTSHEVLG